MANGDDIQTANFGGARQNPPEKENRQNVSEQREQVTPTRPKSIIDELDRDALANHILDTLTKDIRDRDNFGWTFMRQYDILSYNGFKSRLQEPWKDASNFAVPLTPTLLDTGHANTLGSIYSDRNRIVNVTGIGPEDIRNEKNLESLLNWQILNDIEDSYNVLDRTVHKAFKHGNAIVKVIQGFEKTRQKGGSEGPQRGKVIWGVIPIENFFTAIDTVGGVQPHNADHVYELIPLTLNEKRKRERLVDPQTGEKLYKGIEDLQTGNKIISGTSQDTILSVKDAAAGTSLGERYSRDIFYLLECYQTWWHEDKERKIFIPVELIVWTSLAGQIFRVVENKIIDEDTGEAIRPYSTKWNPYPKDDRFYGDSLPWIIKQAQEELDYAHNQNMNAAEELIKPQRYYDPNSGFDPEEAELAPNGWYPIVNPRQNLFVREYNFNPIFERNFNLYWEYAQRRTGFTELFQGRSPDTSSTLGEAQLRTAKTEIRFRTLFDRFQDGFAELIWLTYQMDKRHLDPDTVIQVMGTRDFRKVEEIFPQGISGKFNFRFASAPITEKVREENNVREFYSVAAASPATQNEATQWRLLNMLADEGYGIKNIERWIPMPSSVNVLSARETIQRIMSGQLDVQPHPSINTSDYIFEIRSFMRSDLFQTAGPEVKGAFQKLLRRVEQIQIGKRQAAIDAQTLSQPPLGLEGIPGLGGAQGVSAGQPGAVPPQGPSDVGAPSPVAPQATPESLG